MNMENLMSAEDFSVELIGVGLNEITAAQCRKEYGAALERLRSAEAILNKIACWAEGATVRPSFDCPVDALLARSYFEQNGLTVGDVRPAEIDLTSKPTP